MEKNGDKVLKSGVDEASVVARGDNEQGIEDVSCFGRLVKSINPNSKVMRVTLFGKKFMADISPEYNGLIINVTMGKIKAEGSYYTKNEEIHKANAEYFGTKKSGFFGIRFERRFVLKIFNSGRISGTGVTEYGEDLIYKNINDKCICQYFRKGILKRQLKLDGIPFDETGEVPYLKKLHNNTQTTSGMMHYNKKRGYGDLTYCELVIRESVNFKYGYEEGFSIRRMIVEKLIMQAGIVAYMAEFSNNLYSLKVGDDLLVYYKDFMRYWYPEEIIIKLRDDPLFDNFFVKQNANKITLERETEDFIIMRIVNI